MEQKICLDTDVAIDFISGKAPEITQLIQQSVTPVYVSVITAFELRLRTANLDPVESFLNAVKILDFDNGTSRIAANIYKDLQKKGKRIDTRDLFIASSCIQYGFKLATNNRKHFSRIHGLELLKS